MRKGNEMNRRLLLIGLIILGFSVSHVSAQNLNWLGYDWYVTWGTATVDTSNRLVITASQASGDTYRGGVVYFPTDILPNPWTQFSFVTPPDGTTIRIEFDGNPEYLVIEISSESFGYYIRNPGYNEYVDTLPMPSALWDKPSHVVSFGMRANGYIDLWLDDWKKMTIMDSSFLESPYLLQTVAQLDVISSTSDQNVIFTNYQIVENYVYVATPPEITATSYTNNIDEGPNPAIITLDAEFIDAEGWDTFTGSIDWGDGAVDPVDSLTFTPDGYPVLSGTGSITSEHTYMNDGVYDATLTITDVEGLSDSASFTVTVNEVPPTASYSWAAEASNGGYTVTLTPSVDTYPDIFDRYEWSVDGTYDSTTYDDSPLTLSFGDPYEHVITLTAYEHDVETSEENSVTYTDTVKALFPQAEIVSVSNYSPNEGESIDIEVGLTNPEEFQITSVKWVFSDGTKATTTNGLVSHQFWNDGTQSFTATINTDQQVSATITGFVEVVEVAPVIEIISTSPTPSIPIGDHVFIQWEFVDSPTDGPWNYQWKTNPVSGLQIELEDWSTLDLAPGEVFTSELYMQSPYYNLLTVTLTPTDGDPVSASVPITIQYEPVYTFTGPTEAESGDVLTYTLTINSPNIAYIKNVKWIVDGTVQQSFKPGINVMTYTTSFTTESEEPVEHTVGIEITDIIDEIHTDQKTVSVVYIPAPPEPETPLELKTAAYQMLEETRDEMNSKIDALGKQGKNVNKAFDSALDYIEESTDAKYWIDEVSLAPKDGRKVFDAEKHAVDKIEYIIDKWEKAIPGDSLLDEWRSVIATLVEADRIIAQNALSTAQSLAGPDPPKKIANHLEKSQSFIDRALLEELEKPDHAIVLYRDAWQHAQEAMKKL